MKKIYNFLAIFVFVSILFFFPIATKLAEHKEYSFYENRNLEPVPTFTKEALFNGTYLPKWEAYFSDQIAFRDEMIYAYTYVNANVFNKVNVNNVIITENALLPYNAPREIDENLIMASCSKAADRLAELDRACKEIDAEFVFVGIPEQRSMLRDDYPDYLENDDEYLTLVENHFFASLRERNVDYINMMEIFSREDYTQEK